MYHLLKTNLSVATVLVFLMGMIQANSSNTSELEKDRETLIHLKKVLWAQAYREHDTALLETILAQEFALIDNEGNWTGKRDELKYLETNQPFPKNFTYHIKRLDLFENGTAIVAGVGEIRATDEKGAYVFIYHSSNVLIKRKGRWQAISSHTSGYRRVPAAEYQELPKVAYQ